MRCILYTLFSNNSVSMKKVAGPAVLLIHPFWGDIQAGEELVSRLVRSNNK